MTDFFHRKPRLAVALIVVAAILVVFGIAYWFTGLGFIALLETIVRRLIPLVIVLIIPAAVILFGLYRGYRANENRRFGAVNVGIVILGSVLAIIGLIFLVARLPYENDRIYAQDIKTVDVQTDYADRAPWTVANNYAQRDQGDIVGEREDAHYVPAPKDALASGGEGTSQYTVIIKARGPLGRAGYAGVQKMDMPTTGKIPAGVTSTCETPGPMGKRLGNFWHDKNLGVSLAAQRPNAHYNSDDVYGYCDGDSPVIIVPLWEYNGILHVTKAPAGVAVYTKDGLEVYSADETADLSLEGPTYPRTLAERQRSAINGSGTWGQWIGSSYGYETTEKDDEDANSGNTTEFTLVDGDENVSFVTPLTPRGSSQSMTAVSSVGGVQTGSSRNEITVNTSPQLPATSTLVTSIKESSVNGDNSWTTRWASGMTIYEVLPAKDGHWVASIGQGQAVSYRADISPEGSVTVTNSDTGASSDSPVDSVTVSGGKPLAEMTEDELLGQIGDATEELQRRQNSEG